MKRRSPTFLKGIICAACGKPAVRTGHQQNFALGVPMKHTKNVMLNGTKLILKVIANVRPRLLRRCSTQFS